MRFQFLVTKIGSAPFETLLDLDDPADARREAMRTLGDLVRDQADKEPHRDIAIEVYDDEGNALARLSMSVELPVR